MCAEIALELLFNNFYDKAISSARLEMKLTQKDLAQLVNEKPSVIQDYEAGKAIPSPQILGKLERALKVKLRGMQRSILTCITFLHIK